MFFLLHELQLKRLQNEKKMMMITHLFKRKLQPEEVVEDAGICKTLISASVPAIYKFVFIIYIYL